MSLVPINDQPKEWKDKLDRSNLDRVALEKWTRFKPEAKN